MARNDKYMHTKHIEYSPSILTTMCTRISAVIKMVSLVSGIYNVSSSNFSVNVILLSPWGQAHEFILSVEPATMKHSDYITYIWIWDEQIIIVSVVFD